MTIRNKIAALLLAGTALAFGAHGAQAAGFYLQEQSVSALGTAFAGAQADTMDASTVFYNPANMTELSGMQVQVGANFLFPNAEFTNTGSTYTGAGTGGPGFTSGDNGGNPFDPAIVPQFYFAMPLMDNALWGGLAVTAPFGLSNDYSPNFVGRYNSIDSELKVIDIAPSLAYRVNNWLSVGGGVDIEYVYANLKTAIPSPGVGAPTVATDGAQRLRGDDWTVGFNLGLHVRPTADSKIGLTYRHGVTHDLEGKIDVDYPTSALLGGLSGTAATGDGAAELNLPDITSIGGSYDVDDRWTVLGSVNWYNWSNFDAIPVTSATFGNSSTPQNYEDSWGFAVGARYKYDEKWTLKAGIQYDQTPTTLPDRSTRVPDGDRLWFAAGATYSITPGLDLDMAGAYINVSDERVNVTETSATNVTTVTKGDTSGSVGITAVSLTFKF